MHLPFFQMENEVQSLLRRNRVLEDERDRVDMRLQAALDKLQEASKVVDEFERSCSLYTTLSNIHGIAQLNLNSVDSHCYLMTTEVM